MAEHCAFDRAQRTHCHAGSGSGLPVQLARAASVSPAWARPVMTGPVVITGASSARAAPGPSRIAPTAVTAAKTLRRRRDLRPRRVSIERMLLAAGAGVNAGDLAERTDISVSWRRDLVFAVRPLLANRAPR